MAGVPSPQNLLARRIAQRLRETTATAALSYEPDWTATLVQRVLGITAEVILDAVAHGEEVQLGRLGHFFPKILDERIVAANIQGGEKKVIPRRVKIDFDPLPAADLKMQEFSDFLNHSLKVEK